MSQEQPSKTLTGLSKYKLFNSSIIQTTTSRENLSTTFQKVTNLTSFVDPYVPTPNGLWIMQYDRRRCRWEVLNRFAAPVVGRSNPQHTPVAYNDDWEEGYKVGNTVHFTPIMRAIYPRVCVCVAILAFNWLKFYWQLNMSSSLDSLSWLAVLRPLRRTEDWVRHSLR